MDRPYCARNPALQRHPITSTSDYQESIGLLDLGNSLYRTPIEESAAESGHPTADFREQPAVPSQEHNPFGQGTHEITTVTAGGVSVTHDTVGAPFSIDPLLYGDMMFNIRYAGALAPGIGPRGFYGSLGDGSGITTLGQGPSPSEPQTQQQFNNPFPSHDGGGSGVTHNTDGLTMWTNAPRGFE